MKPTRKQYKELKDFKFRVQLAIHNALALTEKSSNELPHIITIGKAIFTLYPRTRKAVKCMERFTTTAW